MGEVSLDWVHGKTFIGTDSTKHAIVISTPDEQNGGGVKPSDLLLLAIASCTSVDVIEILSKKRQPPERMQVRVDGTQDTEPPWTFQKIHLHFTLYGTALQQQAVEQATRLSLEKYCSVAATVRGIAEITVSWDIQPGPASALA